MAKSADVFAFRAQFPEFASVKDADVAATLNTADVFLDASLWSVRDFATARFYWVAHMLTLQQMQGASVELGGTGEADLFLRQVRIGERSVGFGQRNTAKGSTSGSGPGEDMLAYTNYGQLFVQLRSRNIIPIAVV